MPEPHALLNDDSVIENLAPRVLLELTTLRLTTTIDSVAPIRLSSMGETGLERAQSGRDPRGLPAPRDRRSDHLLRNRRRSWLVEPA